MADGWRRHTVRLTLSHRELMIVVTFYLVVEIELKTLCLIFLIIGRIHATINIVTGLELAYHRSICFVICKVNLV